MDNFKHSFILTLVRPANCAVRLTGPDVLILSYIHNFERIQSAEGG